MSFTFAGASVGRLFGVPYDDQLEGWHRAGTLRHNQRVMSYSIMPPEQEGEVEMGQTRGARAQPQEEQGQRQRGTRLRRVRDTLTATLRRQKKPSREEVLKSLPTFWPIVTILVALIEVGLLIAVCVTSGLAPIAFTPQQENKEIVGFDNQSEFERRGIVPNFFIGPTKGALIHSGALYTPVSQAKINEISLASLSFFSLFLQCMRDNIAFLIEAARHRLEENSLRCCLSSKLKQCGMLSQQQYVYILCSY